MMSTSNRRIARNWSDLPEELLSIIVNKLQFIEELLSFRSVCVSWRSASTTDSINPANKFPWLLHVEKGVKKKFMFDMVHGKRYETSKFSYKFKTLCLGWKGWVLVVKSRRTVCLLHAFNNSGNISLPDRKSLQEDRYECVIFIKAALSADPFTNQSDYTLLIIYNGARGFPGKLAVWRPGDRVYTKVQVCDLSDATFHGGQLYAVTSDSVKVFDGAGFNLIFTHKYIEKISNDRCWYFMDSYLVKLGRELVLIKRSPDVKKFKLFSVVSDGMWKEIKDLGNKSIFIGTATQAFALENASEIPGCIPNRIYFTELRYGPAGSALYNITNATVESFGCSPPSFWIQPSFD